MDEQQAPAPPKVSVLIVSHNHAVALRRCLQALDRSAGRDEIEIIVADNASRDESSTLDTVFPGATFLRMPRHFGRTKALNIATRTAAAELLLLMSPDVEIGPDTVRTLIATLEVEPDAVAVCPLLRSPEGDVPPQVYQLPQSGELYSLWKAPDSLRPIEPAVEPPGSPAQAVGYAPFDALLVRKIFIRGLNYLDERFGEYGGDLELAQQIRRTGKKILLVPSATATIYPSESDPVSSKAESLLASDRAAGLATFAGKHFGMIPGLLLRVRFILAALGGFQLGQLFDLVTGQKIDGSQTVEI